MLSPVDIGDSERARWPVSISDVCDLPRKIEAGLQPLSSAKSLPDQAGSLTSGAADRIEATGPEVNRGKVPQKDYRDRAPERAIQKSPNFVQQCGFGQGSQDANSRTVSCQKSRSCGTMTSEDSKGLQCHATVVNGEGNSLFSFKTGFQNRACWMMGVL